MGNNNESAVVLLLLFLLFLLTAPLLLWSFHSSFAALQLTARSVSIAATLGLFIVPMLFVFLGIIILAVKPSRGGTRAVAQTHYQWEDDFPELTKEPELPKARPAANKVPME